MSKPDRADRLTTADSWPADPEDHDYPAAAYLSLLAPAAQVDALVAAFPTAQTTTQKPS